MWEMGVVHEYMNMNTLARGGGSGGSSSNNTGTFEGRWGRGTKGSA